VTAALLERIDRFLLRNRVLVAAWLGMSPRALADAVGSDVDRSTREQR
jgi:hypothetical protein